MKKSSRPFDGHSRWLLVAPLAIGELLLVAGPASAASFAGPVSGWEVGTEPSWVSMFEYVPDNVAPNAPILVVVHNCSGNAYGVFDQATLGGMVAAADEHGFIMVLPQTTRTCWDVATTESLTHDGGGDTLAIVHQVRHAVATHGANPDRVYVTGISSGAMVTQAMMATYPDVFKGGAAFAGVPAGCWSVNNPDGQWSLPCAIGDVTHTDVEWGDMARAMYPGYSGPRPRLQLWHGDADTTLSFVNQTEAIKQWTNVFGLPATPDVTTPVTIGEGEYIHDEWKDSCGTTVLDVWTESLGEHGTGANMTAQYSIPFLALDQVAAVDPFAAACMGASGSSSSAGSAGAANAGTAGSPTGNGGGGTTTGGVAPPTAAVPSRPGCVCDLGHSQRRGSSLAWVGMLAVAFGRPRRQVRAGVGA